MSGFWTPTRAFALLVALVFVGVGYACRGVEGALGMLGGCLLPLLCIWFPGILCRWGGYGSGWIFRTGFTSDTPPIMISIGGWVLLIAILIAVLIRFWNG